MPPTPARRQRARLHRRTSDQRAALRGGDADQRAPAPLEGTGPTRTPWRSTRRNGPSAHARAPYAHAEPYTRRFSAPASGRPTRRFRDCAQIARRSDLHAAAPRRPPTRGAAAEPVHAGPVIGHPPPVTGRRRRRSSLGEVGSARRTRASPPAWARGGGLGAAVRPFAANRVVPRAARRRGTRRTLASNRDVRPPGWAHWEPPA
jgi:hypothetical protein